LLYIPIHNPQGLKPQIKLPFFQQLNSDFSDRHPHPGFDSLRIERIGINAPALFNL